MKVQLVVEKGVHYGLELVRTEIGIYRIGRSPEADLPLVLDEYVSREHCQIELSAEGALLRHGRGPSGTFVNSKPVRKSHITDGDTLVVGRSLIRVHLSGVVSPLETIKPLFSGVEGFELVKSLSTDGPGETWWQLPISVITWSLCTCCAWIFQMSRLRSDFSENQEHAPNCDIRACCVFGNRASKIMYSGLLPTLPRAIH